MADARRSRLLCLQVYAVPRASLTGACSVRRAICSVVDAPRHRLRLQKAGDPGAAEGRGAARPAARSPSTTTISRGKKRGYAKRRQHESKPNRHRRAGSRTDQIGARTASLAHSQGARRVWSSPGGHRRSGQSVHHRDFRATVHTASGSGSTFPPHMHQLIRGPSPLYTSL